MHIKFRVFWLVRAVVFSTLLLYNSMIGMFFIIIMINKQCCEYGHHFVYCHELSPLFTVMRWIQISLIKQVIVFVAMTVNITCDFYCVIVQILLH